MSCDFQLTSPEIPERKRDYRAETMHGQTELVHKMVTLREARLAPSHKGTNHSEVSASRQRGNNRRDVPRCR